MSTPADPTPSAPSRVGAAILMVLGIILVLPGICSLVWAGAMVADSGLRFFNDPHTAVFMVFWGICALITWGGVAMILAARRRFVRRATASRTPSPSDHF